MSMGAATGYSLGFGRGHKKGRNYQEKIRSAVVVKEEAGIPLLEG